MDKINEIHNEMKEFFINMVPVPWTKFVFYSECLEGWASLWFGFSEKETGIVCTSSAFYNRYDSYIDTKRNCNHKLSYFIEEYYKANLQKLGSEKIWYSFVFVLNEDGSFNVDYYDKPFEGYPFERNHYVMEKYFGIKYKPLRGKYPSKE
jgi:Protein of unknown function, DUF600.